MAFGCGDAIQRFVLGLPPAEPHSSTCSVITFDYDFSRSVHAHIGTHAEGAKQGITTPVPPASTTVVTVEGSAAGSTHPQTILAGLLLLGASSAAVCA